MIAQLKKAMRKSYPLTCLGYIFNNMRLMLKRLRGNILTDSGTTHSDLSVDDSIKYITTVFNDYKKMAGVEKFYGRIAEVGPGDNDGVALCFLADGCTHADLADRFYSRRDPVQQKKIYAALGITEENFAKITRHYGDQAAAETFFKDEAAYDFIISRSVLEHVDNPLQAIQAMTRALKPGGKLIHKVDLRDHGMFSQHFHPLKFLEVPSPIYRLMTHRSGYPNRVLINAYQACVAKLGHPYTFFITQLAGVDPIEPHVPFQEIPKTKMTQALSYVKAHKSKFAKPFQQMNDADLIVSGFFLVLTKQ